MRHPLNIRFNISVGIWYWSMSLSLNNNPELHRYFTEIVILHKKNYIQNISYNYIYKYWSNKFLWYVNMPLWTHVNIIFPDQSYTPNTVHVSVYQNISKMLRFVHTVPLEDAIKQKSMGPTLLALQLQVVIKW